MRVLRVAHGVTLHAGHVGAVVERRPKAGCAALLLNLPLPVSLLDLAVDIAALGLDALPFKIGGRRAYMVRRLAVDVLRFKAAVIKERLMAATLK